MRIWTIMLLSALVACDDESKDDPSDTADSGDTSTDDTSDSGDSSDTSETGLETGLVDTSDTDVICPGYDTADPNLMVPIGATPLDGEWVGRFRVREEYPNGPAWGGIAPTCEGNLDFVVDGCGGLHLFGSLDCDDWDPNMEERSFPGFPGLPFPALTQPYGDVGGFVIGEIDPSEGFDEIGLELRVTYDGALFPWVGQNGLGESAVAEVEDDIKMVVDFRRRSVPGFGIFKVFEMVACKVGNPGCSTALPPLPDPPDPDPDTDTDTDVGLDTDTDVGLDTDTDTDVFEDTDTDAGTDTDTDAGTDTDTDAGTDTDTDAGTDTDPGQDTDTDGEATDPV